MALGVFVDQLKNAYLQVHSSTLGPDMTFNIWWIQFYFENIGEFLVMIPMNHRYVYQQIISNNSFHKEGS